MPPTTNQINEINEINGEKTTSALTQPKSPYSKPVRTRIQEVDDCVESIFWLPTWLYDMANDGLDAFTFERLMLATPRVTYSLACTRTIHAQTSRIIESSLEEARFPVNRGFNFTFEPASGLQCLWAVARYPDGQNEFFKLEPPPICSYSTYTRNANASTLRVQFGSDLQPGNATLTVQCKEPSVWNFLISDDEPLHQGGTVVASICDPEDGETAEGAPKITDALSHPYVSDARTSSHVSGFPQARPGANQSHFLPPTLTAPTMGPEAFPEPSGAAASSGPADSPYATIPNTHSAIATASPDQHGSEQRPSRYSATHTEAALPVTNSDGSYPTMHITTDSDLVDDRGTTQATNNGPTEPQSMNTNPAGGATTGPTSLGQKLGTATTNYGGDPTSSCTCAC
ncbi:hypothetical protein Q7P37_009710 [Cladosporium fusiforme]